MIKALSQVVWDDEKLVRQVGLVSKEATKEGAEAVLSKMQAGAPEKEGELKESLSIKKVINKNEIMYMAGSFGKHEEPWENTVMAKAVFNEYGHAARGKGRGGGVKRKDIKKAIPAKPFMRPALDASGGAIKSSFHNKLK